MNIDDQQAAAASAAVAGQSHYACAPLYGQMNRTD